MRTIIIFLMFSTNILAQEIIGIPKIVDGDTVYINNYKIRLEGIDAPEIKQKCKKEKLKISSIIGYTFYEEYYCGEHSKENLKAKVKGSDIKCISFTKDRYKRHLAKCFKGKINLNRWMVRNGHAIAYRRYSKEYIPDEDFAKENKLGLWQGKFLKPEKWRKLN
ncbi:MAG: nuclease [Candidatus Pelagibacter sp.]|nr:nuclease [Candidatus Pelagibacter sp.]OUW68301.1 MAG: hypothetical protein CBD62_02090 [Candidatus Pelagibacter sp. TMED202]